MLVQAVCRQREAERVHPDVLTATNVLAANWTNADRDAVAGGAAPRVLGFIQLIREASRGLVVVSYNNLDVNITERLCCRGRHTAFPLEQDSTGGLVRCVAPVLFLSSLSFVQPGPFNEQVAGWAPLPLLPFLLVHHIQAKRASDFLGLCRWPRYEHQWLLPQTPCLL